MTNHLTCQAKCEGGPCLPMCEVTTGMIRAVADWHEEAGKAAIARKLRETAESLEREQKADDERIDWLLSEFHEARIAAIKAGDDYADRVGMRAVVAKLDEEKAVGHIAGTIDGTHYEGPVAGPRQWDDLRDVPADVREVRDRVGDVVIRTETSKMGWWWRGAESAPYGDFYISYAPFTEIVGGAL